MGSSRFIMNSGARPRGAMCCRFAARRPVRRLALRQSRRIMRSVLGDRLAWHHPQRRGDAGAGVLPGPVRDRSGRAARRTTLGRLNPAGSIGCWRRCLDPDFRSARRSGAGGRRRRGGGGSGRARGRGQTGSRGLFWLEPMIEVETPDGRIAYGPVEAADIPALLADGLLTGAAQRLRLGDAGADPVPGPPDPADVRPLRHRRSPVTGRLSRPWRHGRPGRRPARSGPSATIETVLASGLRGRGGAGFPTGIKWKTTAEAKGDRKYIVCNADEGDSGTYADRMLLEGDPFGLIEGMVIAAPRDRRHQRLRLHPIRISRTASPPSTRRWRSPAVPAFSAPTSISSSGSAPALMSAARKPRCWKVWKVVAGRCAPSRRCPPIRACSACPTVINNLVTLATVPSHPARRCGGVSGDWHGPVARHDADPAGRQYPLTAACSKPASASPWANSSTTSAAAPFPAVRCVRFRSAVRWAPISRHRCSTPRSTTRRSPPRMA